MLGNTSNARNNEERSKRKKSLLSKHNKYNPTIPSDRVKVIHSNEWKGKRNGK